MIDEQGYRPNVGIILANAGGELLWAKRRGQNAWQVPQGGIHEDESPEQAMFRELGEEVGLAEADVQVIGCTQGWLRYRLPPQFLRHNRDVGFVGQKQKWFLLRFLGEDQRVRVDAQKDPEFDHWRWVTYWYPLGQIVNFKREVYRRALCELSTHHGRLVRDGA